MKKKIKKSIWPSFFFLFFIHGVFSPFLSSQNEKQKDERKFPPAEHFAVTSAASKIKVDGVLDEKAWQNATVIKLNYEWFPGDNIPAPVDTDCLVTFDKFHLYVAFRCYDPEPQKIRAHLMERDSVYTFIQDDHVVFQVDTFNDELRGFQFRVNPLGVQIDAVFNEFERIEDFSWDAIWDSAGKIKDFGYTVEVSVPFNQLRFPRTNKEQTWGFLAGRSYPRESRHRTISHPRDRNKSCIECQFNKITGFAGISPGKNLEFDPTLTINRTDRREDISDGKMANGRINAEPGITARWSITPNLIFNVTFNPDFSNVEADASQLEVNIRFALKYPEKRPFFLEGGDIFLTPLEAVFTRTIYDPSWGLKMSGKIGKNTIGFIAAQDRYNNLIFPSNQSSTSTSLRSDLYNGVLRYRRDIGKGSTIGILYTGRTGDDYFNHVTGLDGFLRLSQKSTAKFQYLHSETEYPEEVARDFAQKDGRLSGKALNASFQYKSRNLVLTGDYKYLSKYFRADSGFIPRVNFRGYWGNINPIIWGKGGGWFDQISFWGSASRVEDQSGLLTDQSIEFGARYQGPLQSNIITVFNFDKEFYNGAIYDIKRGHVSFGLKPFGGFNLTLFSQIGDSIDYINSRLAYSVLINPAMEFSIASHLNVNFNYIFERFTLKGERIYTANLTQARVVYNFNVRTFVRAIIQYSDTNRNTDLYISQIDQRTKDLFTQFLFSYKINPRTVLFLGYSDNYLGLPGFKITQTNRTFFIKFGYALTL